MWRYLILAAIIIGASTPARSQPHDHLKDCTRALIPAKVDIKRSKLQNLSLAWNTSENDYNEAKGNAAADFKIYGVPVGLKYNDFRTNIKSRLEGFELNKFKHTRMYTRRAPLLI
jgi:hypothetical protein